MTICLPLSAKVQSASVVLYYSKPSAELRPQQAILAELAPPHKRTAKEVAFTTKPTGMGMI